MTIAHLKVVMAGPDPAIHVLAASAGDAGKGVDARVKPAHGDLQLVPIKMQQPLSARLEGLADAGGICVSARVQEDAAGKLDLAF
jgi:hypothetical protein